MTEPKSFLLDEPLSDYLLAHGGAPDELQQALIDETRALGGISMMQISPEQGAFLTILTKLLGARRAVEVGTFTGYSALSIARGLAPGGSLLCCDVSEEWTNVGRKHWEKAGVANRITLEIRPAVETLAALAPDEVFDMAFIDADKPSYPAYYEEILIRLKSNGAILVDNVLWSGNVAKPEMVDENTVTIRKFNDLVASDPRVESVILPIADGLTLIRKK